jgi:hypothetical protein
MARGKPGTGKSTMSKIPPHIKELRDRINAAEKSQIGFIREQVGITEKDLVIVAELVEELQAKKADILRQALSIGLSTISSQRIGKRNPTNYTPLRDDPAFLEEFHPVEFEEEEETETEDAMVDILMAPPSKNEK